MYAIQLANKNNHTLLCLAYFILGLLPPNCAQSLKVDSFKHLVQNNVENKPERSIYLYEPGHFLLDANLDKASDTTKRWKQSVQMLEKSISFEGQKSISEENEIQLKVLQREMENLKLSQTLEQVKNQNLFQHWSIAFLTMTLCIPVFFIFRIYTINKNIKKVLSELIILNEEKQLLTSLITHDLRSPLQVIQLKTSLIRLKDPDNPHISEIDRASERIHQMAQKIINVQLNNQKISKQSFPRVEVQSNISKVFDSFNEIITLKQLKIQFIAPKPPAFVYPPESGLRKWNIF